MSLLLAARRPYIAEQVTLVNDGTGKKVKKLSHLVMFPDKTGDVYLLDRVPPILGDPAKRRGYMLQNEIMPVVRLTVVSGLLEVIPLSDDPTLITAVDSFFNDANSGLGVAYLLAWNYITEEHIRGAIASRNYVAAMGQMTPAEAAKSVNSDYLEYRSQIRGKCRQVLGLPEVKKAAQFAPKPEAEPIKSAEPKPKPVAKKPVATEPSEKDALISEAKALGIKCTKKWSLRALKDAILDAKTQPVPVKAEVV